jgi:hypothetical protein
MRFSDSIIASLFKPINRKQFQQIVDRHDGDAYDKSFKSWDHLVALSYAQLSGIEVCGRWKRPSTPTRSTITTWAPANSPDRHWRTPMRAGRSAFSPRSSPGWSRPLTGGYGGKDWRWCG